MVVATWNINGLRSYQKEFDLKEFLEEQKVDILNLQETKLVDGWDIQKKFQLTDEWRVLQNIATSRKGYSGVATIARADIVQNELDIPNERFQKEGRALFYTYQDCKFANIYFPQGDRTKKDVPYKLEICDYVQNLVAACPGNWIVLGDFNMARQEVDLARPKQNMKNNMFTSEERDKMAQFMKVGLVDAFRERHPNDEGQYTWWPYAYNARERNVGWRLDYIFVSESLVSRLKRIEILPKVLGSDHCPVLMDIEL